MSYLGTKNFELEVAKGNVEGHSIFNRFGLNETVGTTFEDIWTVSTNLTYLTGASAFRMTSNDANDAIAGTGAQRVSITFLDANFDEVTEVLDLVGNGTVDTVGTGMRVVRAFVTQWGSVPGLNIAIIGITAVTGGTTQAEIVVGENQTLISHYTVPNTKTSYMFFVLASVGKNDDAQIQLLKKDATVAAGGFRMAMRFPLFEANFGRMSIIPMKFTEKTDLVIRAKSSTGSIQVGAGFDLIVVDN